MDPKKKAQLNRRLKKAVFRESVGVIKSLVKEGADIHTTDAEGRTPLHTAVQLRLTHTTKVLLELGASLHIRDNCGKTPADIAWDHDTKKLLAEHASQQPPTAEAADENRSMTS